MAFIGRDAAERLAAYYTGVRNGENFPLGNNASVRRPTNRPQR